MTSLCRTMVVGVEGFIGSHLARHLLGRGHRVLGISTSPARAVLAVPRLKEMVEMRLPDPRLSPVVSEFRPDVVAWFIGGASVANSVADPYSDFQDSVTPWAFTLDVLRKCAPDCLLIYPSSAAVYGNPELLPISEISPTRPISPYGYHKKISELLAEEHRALFGLRCAVLRVFSAYGNRLRRQVVYDVCKKLLDPSLTVIEMHGSGDETRDFIHADDIVQAFELIVQTNTIGVINLGSGSETRIATLVELLSELGGWRKEIHFNGAERKGDPKNWRADISRLTQLGFRPQVELPQGLDRYWQWILKTREGSARP